MDEFENSVAAEENIPAEAPADDAQAAEITAEQLITAMNRGQDEETVDVGDDGHSAQPEASDGKKTDKKISDDQYRAIIRQQRKTIFENELGMSEAEVRELILAHKAEEMSKADPDISPKAARRILDAESGRNTERLNQYTDELKTLMDDGWTPDELREFAADAQTQSDLQSGKTVRQAARAYMRRATQTPAPRRTGVPTVRSRTTESARDPNDIASMTDEEFDRFARRVEEEALKGRRIRI